MRPSRITQWAVGLALILFGAQSQATPIWIVASTPFGYGSWGRIYDIPDDFKQGSFALALGAIPTAYKSRPDVQYEAYPDPHLAWLPYYQGGSFKDYPVSVGFSVASASDASNPDNWKTQAFWMLNPAPTPAVLLEGKASGGYAKTSSLYHDFNQFDSTMDSASRNLALAGGSDVATEVPSFLLDLINHPGRVSMNEFSSLSLSSGGSSTVTIAAPAPIPEPTALVLFGVVIGGGLIRQWKCRKSGPPSRS